MIRVGAAPIAASTSKTANIEQIGKTVAWAMDAGVELLVLPEYSSYWDAEEFGRGFSENAEPVPDGEFVSALRTMAKDAGIWIVAGMLETVPNDDRRVFNTVVVVSSTGETELSYRKVHLYDAFGGTESTFLVRGETDQPTDFRMNGLRFRVSTCYDVRFPESVRRTDMSAADVILLPAVWTPGPLKGMHWETLTRARAIENIAYLVAVTPPPPESIGQSRALHPDGTILREVGAQATPFTVDVDPREVRAERRRNTSLENRRYRVMGDER